MNEELRLSDDPSAPKTLVDGHRNGKVTFAGVLVDSIPYGTPDTPAHPPVHPCSIFFKCLVYSKDRSRVVLTSIALLSIAESVAIGDPCPILWSCSRL